MMTVNAVLSTMTQRIALGYGQFLGLVNFRGKKGGLAVLAVFLSGFRILVVDQDAL
jgi:hypothetical protein